MTIAFVLGGGACVHEDLAAAEKLCTPDHVVACNDFGAEYPGELDAFVTLHPDELPRWIGARRENGYPEPKRIISHKVRTMQDGKGEPFVTQTHEFRWQDFVGVSGSSGLFCVKVAFEILGAKKVILCGVPMDDRPHFFDTEKWEAVRNFTGTWEQLIPVLRDRVRSMSGWTRETLGAPSPDWIG